MNRIQYWTDEELQSPFGEISHPTRLPTDELAGAHAASTSSAELLASLERGESEDAHCIFTPLHYERNYAYPLIVWLHGPEDNERQVTKVLPLVSKRNYVGVGPRGTVCSQLNLGAYAWSQELAHIDLAERRVLAAIAAARRWLNIAPDRIYLAGYDCGGTMAFRIALASPHLFAGVLSIGGGLPNTLRPFAQLNQLRGFKVFLAMGRDATIYPPADACGHLRLLYAAGMSVCMRQYPCGDDVTTNMLTDMDRWIMEQVATATQAAPQDEPSGRSRGK